MGVKASGSGYADTEADGRSEDAQTCLQAFRTQRARLWKLVRGGERGRTQEGGARERGGGLMAEGVQAESSLINRECRCCPQGRWCANLRTAAI